MHLKFGSILHTVTLGSTTLKREWSKETFTNLHFLEKDEQDTKTDAPSKPMCLMATSS